RERPQRRTRNSTIALINVVFLLLIFFLLAGTVAPPLDRDVELINTAELDGSEPPDALVLRADGTVTYRGEITDAASFMATRDNQPVRIVPDRAASGQRLIEVTGNLRRSGAASVIIVTELALP
ncbi:MAG: biopolymer transporter ExbD, partial [Pseudomonadota bacterium]